MSKIVGLNGQPVKPEYPIPGKFLKTQVLDVLGLTVEDAAKSLCMDAEKLQRLIDGTEKLDIDSATRFATATGSHIAMWVEMQMTLDIIEAEEKGTSGITAWDMTAVRKAQQIKESLQ